MQEINLQPLFDYLETFKAEMLDKFNSLENRVSALENSMDRLTKIVTDLRDEMVVMNHRVEKLEMR